MGGYSLLYYSVLAPDGEEIICSYEDSAEKVKDMVKYMKERVDEHILDPHSEDMDDIDKYVVETVNSFPDWKKQACDTRSYNLKTGNRLRTNDIDGIITGIKHYGSYLRLMLVFLKDEELIDDDLTVGELLEMLKQRTQ